MSNTFGKLFRLTTAGESHGPALTGIIDGMPPGVKVDFERIDLEISRRKPGQEYSSQRSEPDSPEFLSGILDGTTLGTPIAFTIKNTDCIAADYDQLKTTFRPGHADFTYQAKYGIRDIRGGGRASARETALRVVAGALAMQVLEKHGIRVEAFTSGVGQIACNEPMPQSDFNFDAVWQSPVRCPYPNISEQMVAELERVRNEGDTVGCTITALIYGLPSGVGEPVYDKLSARLAYAMMSINAAHAFEYGDGLSMASARGSEMIDSFKVAHDGSIITESNHSGGILGGISNAMPVVCRVGFKPLATMMRPIESIDLKGNPTTITPRGRHDVCAAPRAVPVVRAMAAITVLDMLMIAGKI